MELNTIVFVAVFAGLAVGLIVFLRIGSKKQRKEREALQAQLELEWKGGPDQVYRPVYNIAGINKHGATPRDCGYSRGWAARDMGNKHDKNAIAIFIGDRHVGYLSKEIAKELAPRFEDRENAVPCLLSITTKRDESKGYYYFVGSVQLLWEDTE